MNIANIVKLIKQYLLILTIFVSGCTITGTSKPNSEDTLIVVTSQTPSFEPTEDIKPTQTLVMAEVTSPLPEIKSTEIQVASPIPTMIPTESMIPTPLSTIPPGELEMFALGLLQINEQCLLPCWWGTILGQSGWDETELFLRSFATEIRRYPIANDLTGYGVTVKIPEGINFTNQIGPFYTVNSNGIIETIEIALGNLPNYSLPQILTVYGAPSEIWLNTIDFPREGSLPFRLLLLYRQQGFIIQYAEEAEMEGDLIVSCFSDQGTQEDPFLFLWNPDINYTFDDVLSRAGSVFDEGQFYLQLEEATDINIETFYQTMSNVNNMPCIETPSELWIEN